MESILRSVWSEPRPAGAPRWLWQDAVVLLLVPTAVLEGVLRPELAARPAQVAITTISIALLLLRRRHPLLVLLIPIAGYHLVDLITPGQVDMYSSAAMLIAAYAVVRWGSGREAVLGGAVLLAQAVPIPLAQGAPMADIVGGTAVLLAAMGTGLAMRYRSGARARTLETVRAVERERLARDLHDTVAHHVSAIAIRAQVGQAVAGTRPEAAVEELRLIEAEAGRALAEMRTMVRMLRADDSQDLAPQPALADLERLADPDGELPVTVQVSADDDVAAAVAGAAFRIAQEAVTNSRRHARHATTVAVVAQVDRDAVRLQVHDDGLTSGLRTASPPGYGIVGMAERARLLGGTCEAGPDPDGGWVVTAVLPRRFQR